MALALLLAFGSACQHQEPYHPTRDEARLAAQDLVKNQLMSSGYIKFGSDLESSVEELPGNRFRVTSFVDYKGVGGMAIRTNYSCVIRCKGKNQWDIEDMKFG